MGVAPGFLWKESIYGASADWVFDSDAGRPKWQETILARQLKSAADRTGIGKIGWHSVRHTYSTKLRSPGTDIGMQQCAAVLVAGFLKEVCV